MKIQTQIHFLKMTILTHLVLALTFDLHLSATWDNLSPSSEHLLWVLLQGFGILAFLQEFWEMALN